MGDPRAAEGAADVFTEAVNGPRARYVEYDAITVLVVLSD